MNIKANERCKGTNNAGGKNCMKHTFGLVFVEIKKIFQSEMLKSYMWQPTIKPQLMSHMLKPSTPPSCCCSSQSSVFPYILI